MEIHRVSVPLPAVSHQALRYPYFQVGQILGPRPQSQEVKKVPARTQVSKQTSENKRSSSESKGSTDSVRSQQQHHHQPLQQISLPQNESKPRDPAVRFFFLVLGTVLFLTEFPLIKFYLLIFSSYVFFFNFSCRELHL